MFIPILCVLLSMSDAQQQDECMNPLHFLVLEPEGPGPKYYSPYFDQVTNTDLVNKLPPISYSQPIELKFTDLIKSVSRDSTVFQYVMVFGGEASRTGPRASDGIFAIEDTPVSNELIYSLRLDDKREKIMVGLTVNKESGE